MCLKYIDIKKCYYSYDKSASMHVLEKNKMCLIILDIILEGAVLIHFYLLLSFFYFGFFT